MYELIQKSKMPKARKFQQWVNSDLLPQLTKTGNYNMVTDAPMEQVQQMNAIHQVYSNIGQGVDWMKSIEMLQKNDAQNKIPVKYINRQV